MVKMICRSWTVEKIIHTRKRKDVMGKGEDAETKKDVVKAKRVRKKPDRTQKC